MTESDFNNVSRTLLNAIRKFYEKEENIKAFKIWQAERQKLQLNNKKLLMNNSFDEQKNVANTQATKSPYLKNGGYKAKTACEVNSRTPFFCLIGLFEIYNKSEPVS